MAPDDPDRAGAEHLRVLDAGEHLFQQLRMTDVTVDGADLAMALDLDSRLTNPRGALQGGLVATLADIVAGRAAMTGLEPGSSAPTANLTIHYLSPIVVGPAQAEARVLRRGRTSVVVRVDIYDAGTGRLGATATVAFTVLGPR